MTTYTDIQDEPYTGVLFSPMEYSYSAPCHTVRPGGTEFTALIIVYGHTLFMHIAMNQYCSPTVATSLKGCMVNLSL